jgi:hypothetical protein
MNLNEYVPALGDGGYVPSRPALNEWRWRNLWRLHRAQLIDQGCAILIGGRVHVHPARTDAFLIELGKRRARDRVPS